MFGDNFVPVREGEQITGILLRNEIFWSYQVQ